MTEREKWPPGKPPETEEDLTATAEELFHALKKLDKAGEPPAPELEWFENLVKTERERNKMRLLKELTAFLLVALMVLGAVLFTIAEMPMVFYGLQGAAVLFVLAYGSVRLKKQVNDS